MKNPRVKERGTAIDPSIGRNVLYRRREKGLDQRELATLADVSVVVISRLETGQQSVSAERLRAIAHALGVTSDTFLETEEKRGRSAESSKRSE